MWHFRPDSLKTSCKCFVLLASWREMIWDMEAMCWRWQSVCCPVTTSNSSSTQLVVVGKHEINYSWIRFIMHFLSLFDIAAHTTLPLLTVESSNNCAVRNSLAQVSDSISKYRPICVLIWGSHSNTGPQHPSLSTASLQAWQALSTQTSWDFSCILSLALLNMIAYIF